MFVFNFILFFWWLTNPAAYESAISHGATCYGVIGQPDGAPPTCPYR